MRPELKKWIQTLGIFAIGAAFLFFVFKGTNWAELKITLSQANYFYIGIGMAVSLVSHWLRAYRATLVYKPMGYNVTSFASFNAVIIGYFINYFIPRGGELARCSVLYKTNKLPIDKGIGTVITERLVDLAMLVVVILAVFALQFNLLSQYIRQHISFSTGNTKWIVLVGIILLGLAIYLSKKYWLNHPVTKTIVNKLQGFKDGLLSIKQVNNPWLFIALSAAIWLCYILMMYYCLFALEATANLNFNAALTVFAIGTIGIIIPAPGAGAGTYHFAVMQGLLLFNVTQNMGLAYATLVHGSQMVVLLFLGLLSSVWVWFIQGKKNNNG